MRRNHRQFAAKFGVSVSRKLVLLLFLVSYSFFSWAKAPEFSSQDEEKVPPRIIRTCCSFGSDLKMVGLPMVKVTQITSLDQLGEHKYLGSADEGNGIIYTAKGGFIDLGHLRDQADWTAYLYLKITESNGQQDVRIPLRYEGGVKTLYLNLSDKLSDDDAQLLAGAMAYDISVWHEIATWFGSSMIPMIPERYSSFSIEDAYSNVTGITLGIEALKSDLPYDMAMTEIINNRLDQLGAVKTLDDTYNAMEAVKDVWWTRERKLPTRKVLLQRDLQVYPEVSPWLVSGWEGKDENPLPILVPSYTLSGKPLADYYSFEIKLNHKFPFRKMFPDREERIITQRDFNTLLERVEWELKDKDRLKGEVRSKYIALDEGDPDIIFH
ncbi:MAG: DUF4056 domain-containing protein [Saprospiraceae bacterium]|nr:DUF4056 domain-containing protein [Saprospiraceae bacterium]